MSRFSRVFPETRDWVISCEIITETPICQFWLNKSSDLVISCRQFCVGVKTREVSSYWIACDWVSHHNMSLSEIVPYDFFISTRYLSRTIVKTRIQSDLAPCSRNPYILNKSYRGKSSVICTISGSF